MIGRRQETRPGKLGGEDDVVRVNGIERGRLESIKRDKADVSVKMREKTFE